jgi:hypothetical protein
MLLWPWTASMRALVAVGARVRARKHGAEWIAAQVLGLDRADVGLDYLTDFLLETHRSQQRRDPLLGSRIDDAGASRGRPALRVDALPGSRGHLRYGAEEARDEHKRGAPRAPRGAASPVLQHVAHQ